MTRKRYQAEEIIRHAGLEPWPKVSPNLRSTRETELAEQFPMHVVCKWIGNSQPVAAATAYSSPTSTATRAAQ